MTSVTDNLDRVSPEDAARFWAKVHIPNVETACWEWTAALGGSGRDRGRFYWNGMVDYAPRVAWRIAHGRSPGTLFVCHQCDNPRCVRPDHLFLGTAADNVHDAQVKGRLPSGCKPRARKGYRRGENSPQSRLVGEQVRAIRSDLAAGVPLIAIARAYRVNRNTIRKIRDRKAWTHVE